MRKTYVKHDGTMSEVRANETSNGVTLIPEGLHVKIFLGGRGQKNLCCIMFRIRAFLMFTFAVFEKKRGEVLRIVEGLREWQK